MELFSETVLKSLWYTVQYLQDYRGYQKCMHFCDYCTSMLNDIHSFYPYCGYS